MKETTNFAILGTQRTGTTLVRTSLSSHPDVLCSGEVFLLGRRPYKKEDGYWAYARRSLGNRIRSVLAPRRATAAFLDEMYSRAAYGAIGFKLMLRHYLARPYILDLLEQRFARVILVQRRNSLKTLVSRRTAAESGVYHVSDSLKVSSAVKEWKAKSIALDTSTLLSDLDSINAEYDTWRGNLSLNIERLEVVYEDYVADPDSGNAQILDFLGVHRLPLTSDLKKVNPDSLHQLIANYPDVAQVLEGTRYASYLDAK